MKDIQFHLERILSAIEDIESYKSGMDLAAFQSDDKTLSATILKLEIIGEAARRIPDAVRKLHPEVPWQELADRGEALIRRYREVKPQQVWETITKDLPTLKLHLRRILEENQ